MFGGMRAIKESCRDARGTRWLSDLADDMRYSMRVFCAQPGLRRCGGPVAGARHRREHGHLLDRQQPPASIAARPRSRAARDPDARFVDQPNLGAGARTRSLSSTAPRLLIGRVRSRPPAVPRIAVDGALDERQLLRRAWACRRSSDAHTAPRTTGGPADRTAPWRSSATRSGSVDTAARPTSSAVRSRSIASRTRSSA